MLAEPRFRCSNLHRCHSSYVHVPLPPRTSAPLPHVPNSVLCPAMELLRLFLHRHHADRVHGGQRRGHQRATHPAAGARVSAGSQAQGGVPGRSRVIYPGGSKGSQGDPGGSIHGDLSRGIYPWGSIQGDLSMGIYPGGSIQGDLSRGPRKIDLQGNVSKGV